MVLMMSVGFGCLSAHSGPPLAASQGNSRARTLRSLSASVTRVVLSGPCPSPRARSSLLLWFVVLPLPLVKGKHSKPSRRHHEPNPTTHRQHQGRPARRRYRRWHVRINSASDRPEDELTRLRPHGFTGHPREQQARQVAIGQFGFPAGEHDERVRPVAPGVLQAVAGVGARQRAQRHHPRQKWFRSSLSPPTAAPSVSAKIIPKQTPGAR